MPEWILYAFAYIGAVAVASAIIGGLTLAIARAVRWKRKTDEGYERMVGRTSLFSNRLCDLESREHAVWTAIEDLTKRLNRIGETVEELRDAEKEA